MLDGVARHHDQRLRPGGRLQGGIDLVVGEIRRQCEHSRRWQVLRDGVRHHARQVEAVHDFQVAQPGKGDDDGRRIVFQGGDGVARDRPQGAPGDLPCSLAERFIERGELRRLADAESLAQLVQSLLRRLEEGNIQRAVLDGAGQRLMALEHRRRRLAGLQQVGARRLGPDRGIGKAVALGNRVHRHRVGHDHAVETHLLAEQTGQDARRERRRMLVERRENDVRRHDRRDAGLDPGAEWGELDGVQALDRLVDHRQAVVGIDVRVAVPGKVLDGRDDALVKVTLDRRDAGAGDDLRRLAERPRPDDRVFRVDVHVHGRRVVHVDADLAKLPGGDAGHLADVGIIHRAERHRARDGDHVRREASDDSAFLVGGDEEGRHAFLSRGRLQLIGQGADLVAALEVVGEEEYARRADTAEGILVGLREDRSHEPEHDALAGKFLITGIWHGRRTLSRSDVAP